MKRQEFFEAEFYHSILKKLDQLVDTNILRVTNFISNEAKFPENSRSGCQNDFLF